MFITHNKVPEKSLLTRQERFWSSLGMGGKVTERMGYSLPSDKYSESDSVKKFANQA